MKDFVEKRITFTHDNAVYSFCSAVPAVDSSETEVNIFPRVEGIERGETHFGVMCIRRDATTQRILVESVMRCNGKLPVSNAVLKILVPSAIKDWTSKLATHLQS